MFCITWNRTSSVTERLLEAEDYDGVLGILEVSIPHVVVRDFLSVPKLSEFAIGFFLRR